MLKRRRRAIPETEVVCAPATGSDERSRCNHLSIIASLCTESSSCDCSFASALWGRQRYVARCFTLFCGARGSPDVEKNTPVSRGTAAVVYGNDDRRDYYELEEPSVRQVFEAHSVALISKHRIASLLDGSLAQVPTWGELERLCPDQPFAEQPAAAFCTGVLVEQQLALTSRHCLVGTNIGNIRVVLGYYLLGAGAPAMDQRDVHEVSGVVSSSNEDEVSNGVDFPTPSEPLGQVRQFGATSLSRTAHLQPLIQYGATTL